MRVDCEDQMSLLADMELITTADYYGEYPETIIADVLENDGSVSSAEIDIDTIEGRTELFCAWTDSKIIDILQTLCDRYGYYLRVNISNIFNVKKISDSAPVDHIYYDRKSILEYIPDNNFSDYVNRIIVQSEERVYRRVIYPEKEVQVVHGTIGWWQGNELIKIPYSDDNSLECLYPYPIMEYLTGNFLFGGGALKWELTADGSNKFCTLKLIAPIMIEQLIAALTTALATDWIPLIGGAISAVGFLEIFNILASVSNWSARIMAQPIGYVRAAIQGVANDLPMQTKTGRIISRVLTEPLAYTEGQCKSIADHEMMITARQRSRVTIRKIGHLQDEEGDTIKIPHPISEEFITIFITSLTRRIHIPLTSDSEAGVFDTIEGWKLG